MATKICPKCNGSGVVPDNSRMPPRGDHSRAFYRKTCPTCRGKGRVRVER